MFKKQTSSITTTPEQRKPAVWNREPVAGVQRIIAVASGKGGVGKSTVTVGLAHALAAQGVPVGILDADIYGPSIPRMLGLKGVPAFEEGKMIPLEAHGIKAMSIGVLIDDKAAVLRAPMLTKHLTQMLRGTRWHDAEGVPLHTLLIDMPPGTGDVHLSLAQTVPVDGAIIVTTPQAIAVVDARKSAEMFAKVNIPLLGVIENMSWFEENGQKHRLFGEGGGEMLAEMFSLPLLGKLPLHSELGVAMDKGEKPECMKIFAGLLESIG